MEKRQKRVSGAAEAAKRARSYEFDYVSRVRRETLNKALLVLVTAAVVFSLFFIAITLGGFDFAMPLG